MLDKNITSFKNPQVKNVIALRERKEREKSKLTIVEGAREIGCAFKAGVEFKEVYVCREFFGDRGQQGIVKELELKKVKVFETTKEIFEKISFGDRHEGVLAVCRQPSQALRDLKVSDSSLFVIVEKIEKPGNLGAILRSCDGAGVDGLIICEGATDLYNPNAVRASLGTIFSVKVVESSNEKTLAFLKENGVKAFATTPTAATVYTQADFKNSAAIILGSEQEGLSDFWINHCDIKVKIPMRGKADSLNVSTTAALVIYEALRQRGVS
ncbi:MAG TPA: RNA methyltransferase [Candidatus Omnitrophota bacterium]|nr:RNA methyltransferase [Candidatus Omnitrophota bacterium]HPD84338.1 RNA methyltransferase [Candidatus Omnitrophota bacterium]HRZ03196.1 RNA methyltransferase [Candidatus Omnitrophota bacterium]